MLSIEIAVKIPAYDPINAIAPNDSETTQKIPKQISINLVKIKNLIVQGIQSDAGRGKQHYITAYCIIYAAKI